MSNSAIVAAAGSGKTHELALRALAVPLSERALVATYTNNGASELRSRIENLKGFVPANIEIQPWLTFLLRHGARPYQGALLNINEIDGLYLDSREVALKRKGWRPRQDNPRPYYLQAGRIYRDVLSDFVLHCNRETGGAVFRRLARIFQHMLLDEVQDMAGRDLDVIEETLRSPIEVTMVADPRQRTYATSQSRTNKASAGTNVQAWFERLERAGLLSIERHAHSRRCVQEVCDFADRLYPELPATESLACHGEVELQGVHLVKSTQIADYLHANDPQLLVWDKRSETYGRSARNYGAVKGLTFDRVLIQPTSSIAAYLQKGKPLEGVTRAKFYVAVTRARYSVGIVLDRPGGCGLSYWSP
ncbi:DNA/RNA helicase superfamily I [Pseudonocardia sp. D17]|nr:DNA/RNA helicase superfamily I [Pseudonocardia sp. D17]